MNKRMKIALVSGMSLGVICIVGAFVRSGFEASVNDLFSLWYNRVIIGLVIGAPWQKRKLPVVLLRGGLLGLMVSLAFYSTTGFSDTISFLAGMIYGVIIEIILFKKS
ncbi:MAG: hypothetical protein JXR88_04090 [Clostridia bacterium]|nr:hypothetical protein [Clostridia bacterium]